MKKINLAKIISKNIATRQSVELIRNELSDITDDLIELDFIDVDFISRSFADEILNLKQEYKRKNIILKFINTNKEISEMFKIVSSQRNKSPKIFLTKIKDLKKPVHQF